MIEGGSSLRTLGWLDSSQNACTKMMIPFRPNNGCLVGHNRQGREKRA